VLLIDLNTRQVREQSVSTRDDGPVCSSVSDVVFSEDGRFLAAGLRSGTVLFWDLDTPTSRPTIVGRRAACVSGLGFTSGGTGLLAGFQSGDVVLWERGLKEEWRQVHAQRLPGRLDQLATSRDGSLVICVGAFGLASRETAKLREGLPVPAGSVPKTRVAISADARSRALACDARHALTIGTEASCVTLADPDLGVPHRDETTHLEFNLDGALLVSGSRDNTVKLWDVAAMRLLLRLPVFSQSAVIPAFQPGGRLLAIGSSEGVMLHELLGLDVCTTKALSRNIVEDFAFLPTGWTDDLPPFATLRSDASATSAGELVVEIWPGGSPAPRQPLALGIHGHDQPNLRLEADPLGRELLVRHDAGLLVIDLGASDRRDRASPGVPTRAACWSPDGLCVWGITHDDRVISWKLPDLKERTQWSYRPASGTKDRGGLSSLAAGGQWVVAGTRAGTLQFVRAADGQLDHAALATGPSTAMALSPDERVAVCGTQRGDLDLVRVQDGQVLAGVKAHAEMITEITFHPSGDYFATNARDRNVILWQLGPASITELMRFIAPSGRAASAIRFSSDGRSLGILFAQERAVRVWNLRRLHQELRTVGLDWDAASDGPVPTPKAR
jgi:WD40 repeat protein